LIGRQKHQRLALRLLMLVLVQRLLMLMLPMLVGLVGLHQQWGESYSKHMQKPSSPALAMPAPGECERRWHLECHVSLHCALSAAALSS
jgi:hypothetical protein